MAKTTKNSRGGASRQPKRRYTKKGADRYELYQLAVQSAEHDVKLVSRIYRRLRGREPVGLREDFCGTAQLSAEWVKLGEQRWAEGYDLDPEPLSWGRKHNLDPLGANARPDIVVTASELATSGVRVPHFYEGNLFCPVGTTPLYLGQPVDGVGTYPGDTG